MEDGHRQKRHPAVTAAIITASATIIVALIGLYMKECRGPDSVATTNGQFYIHLERYNFRRGNASVFLNGNLVGELSVGPGYFEDQLVIELERPQQIKYEIRATVEVVRDGSTISYQTLGQGIIEPSSDEVIELSINSIGLSQGNEGPIEFATLIQQDDSLGETTETFDELVGQLAINPDFYPIEFLIGQKIEDDAALLGLSVSESEKVAGKEIELIVDWLFENRWISESVYRDYKKASK